MTPAIGPDLAVAPGRAPLGEDVFQKIEIVGRVDAFDNSAVVDGRFKDGAEADFLHAPPDDFGALRLLESFDDAAEGKLHAAVMKVVIGGVERLHGQTTSP